LITMLSPLSTKKMQCSTRGIMTTSQTLVSLAQRARIKNDATQSIDYYEIYDNYFETLRDKPIKFAEIGVSDGISLNIFSE